MLTQKIYISAAKQISIQKPLQDSWMEEPIIYNGNYVRSIDPNFKEFLQPNQARRLGKLLGRALITSLEVIKETNINNPDSIINGTGLGCVENTELFLNALTFEGEQFLKPTYFMQSTHNTISSLIGIQTKSHGYNATYAHKSVSFDYSLLDAYLQFNLGKINTALVCGNDEITQSYFNLLKKIGFVGVNNEIASEVSVAVMLNKYPTNSICAVAGYEILYKPSFEQLEKKLNKMLTNINININDLDGVMVGVSGNVKNDNGYTKFYNLFKAPLLHYKHIFGECYTSSALGFYAAVSCFKYNYIPDILYLNKPPQIKTVQPKYILLFNHSDCTHYSLTLLEFLCGK